MGSLVDKKRVADTVRAAVGRLATELPGDVERALRAALERESNPRAAEVLRPH